MKASPVVAAINGDGLAGTERDRAVQKGIHGSDIDLQISETKRAILSDGDFAIPFPPQQFVHKIGHGDAAVPREL
jgi:hypothetical protein